MRLRPLISSLLVLTAGIAIPATTAAAHAAKPAAASGWLARQLVDGERFEAEFGGEKFPDQGLTIDAVLGFAATKSSGTNAAKATTWLAKPEILSGYAGDGADESYAGAAAKLTLAAQVRGLNPATFGGVDLPARLRALITPSGRISDKSAFGDYSNAFSQSLGIIALKRTPAGVPASAVNFAVGTQCADGGFPIFFGTTPCVSDTDATAMVVQALLATHRYADAAEGLDFLASKQQADGGLAAGAGAATPNTNTTGLAGQAFRAGGRTTDANQAKSYLLGRQQGCSAPAAVRGAIAYDATGFDPATAPRATAQAVLGLGAPGLHQLTAAGSSPTAATLSCS
ncbi:peptidase [Kribbella sandramycini]|uniref:Peptidase n=1 Tax=Kribbella sandramycini TaxID=60450 RepID=A0A7Y4KX80_9ACTN|nr:prenyltransferase/squalene oxidase repeat-containing protein [Kribbella sandramycini]MBB6569841.1 hypothetical protein [Kribbella sandramycini]NOL40334.1 peptidase [Kribbella sandramycini]